MLLSQGRHSVFHCCFVYFLPDPLKFHIPALLLGRKTRENDERDSDPAQTPAQAATGVWPGDGEGSSVLTLTSGQVAWLFFCIETAVFHGPYITG